MELLTGLPHNIAQYHVKDAVPKHEKHSLVLRVSNNIHQIAQLESVEFVEEWTEEEKIPVKKDVPVKKEEAPKKEEGKNGQANQEANGEAKADDKKVPEPEKAPVQEPKIEYEIKKKTKKATSILAHDTQNHALPPAQRKQYKTAE